jgi:hypothetical protein
MLASVPIPTHLGLELRAAKTQMDPKEDVLACSASAMQAATVIL